MFLLPDNNFWLLFSKVLFCPCLSMFILHFSYPSQPTDCCPTPNMVLTAVSSCLKDVLPPSVTKHFLIGLLGFSHFGMWPHSCDWHFPTANLVTWWLECGGFGFEAYILNHSGLSYARFSFQFKWQCPFIANTDNRGLTQKAYQVTYILFYVICEQ